MSIALGIFYFTLSLSIHVAHMLSKCSGVGPCLCPNSSKVTRIGTRSFAVMYPAPVSVSCAEDTTASMILHTICIAVLCGGGLLSECIGRFSFDER